MDGRDDDRHGTSPRPGAAPGSPARRRASGWWYLLFLIQFIAVLWPPFFNRADPHWLGIPFFYWYQLLWVLLGAAGTAIVYLVTA